MIALNDKDMAKYKKKGDGFLLKSERLHKLENVKLLNQLNEELKNLEKEYSELIY